MTASVLLVRPPFRDPLAYKPPPMALCCLAANLVRHRPEVRVDILDAVALDLDAAATTAEIVARRPTILAMTVKTPQASNAYAIARSVKEHIPLPVIMGGNHVTVLPDEVLENGADIAVVGEGELTFVDVIGHLLDQTGPAAVAGAAWRTPDGTLRGGPRALADLDELERPDWSLIDLSLYNENIHIHPRRALQVMASRGCPFSCTFCSTYLTWTNRVRWRTPASVVDELRDGLEAHGHDAFHFYDDDILENRSWIEEFAAELEKARLPIDWHGIVRVNNVITCAPLLERLRRTGCRGFAFGFETGLDEIYRKQRKGMTLSLTLRAVDLIRDSGFDLIEPLLMNLYPGETVESMILSARLVRLLRARVGVTYHTSRYFATPYPGTAFFHDHPRDGILLARRWDEHFTHFANFIPHSLLQSSVRGVRLDHERYRAMYRLHFRTYGDFTRYLQTEEMETFLASIDDRRLLGECSAALAAADTFDDFARVLRRATGLSEISGYEFSAKLLIHAASYGFLSSEGSDAVFEELFA